MEKENKNKDLSYQKYDITENQKENFMKMLKKSYKTPLAGYTENVVHPQHYNQHPSGIECIDIARHYCFSIGNAIKYLWRAGLKKDNGMTMKSKEIEDLRKAVWYIEDRISELMEDEEKEEEEKEKTNN